MGQGYRIDVFNNTGRSLNVAQGPNGNMNANGIPQTPVTLAPNTWISSKNGNQPYYVEVNSGNQTAFITVNVSVVNLGSGSFRVEFNTNSVQNFSGGLALFASAGDIQPAQITGSPNDWIFGTLYLAAFEQWTQAILVLFEAVGASSNIIPAYPPT
jgi:hypothetical protein